MGTHIHVSGLSYFCTEDRLRQAFIPFGTVVLARVLRDVASWNWRIVHCADNSFQFLSLTTSQPLRCVRSAPSVLELDTGRDLK